MSADDVFVSDTDRERDDIGLRGEQLVAERFNGELVANDTSAPDWVDVLLEDDLVVDTEFVAPAGTPVQVKLAAWRVRDGQSRRQGRWMLYRDSFATLLEQDGLLALGVHDPQLNDPLVLDVFFPEAIRALGLTWVQNARSRTREVARLRWGRVFASDLVDGTRRTLLESTEGSA